MEYTKNLHLKKPSDNDDYDIKNENDNMDILDAAFNMGDVVKVDDETDLPEPTEEALQTLFYINSIGEYRYCKLIDDEYRYVSLVYDEDINGRLQEITQLLNNKLDRINYDKQQPTEANKGKLFYDADNNKYLLVIKEGINKTEIATNYTAPQNTGGSSGDFIIIEDDDFLTYEEGLLEDRPEATYTEVVIYYATDVDKHYAKKLSSGGIAIKIWEEIEIKTVDVLPKSGTGLYKVTENGFKYVYSISPKYKFVDLASTGKSSIIMIPISGWTTHQDSNNNDYYTIDIEVDGVTPEFQGVRDTDYIKPLTYNVNENESYLETFKKITNIEGMNNSIRVYANEPITQSIKIILYGV